MGFRIPASKILIRICLSERESIFSPDGLVLFCPGSNGADFAAFVATDHSISQPNRNLIDLFRNNIGLCGNNLLLINRLRDMATVDSLVRIPNRLAFIEAIDSALKNNRSDGLQVMLLEIDRFARSITVTGFELRRQFTASDSGPLTGKPYRAHPYRQGRRGDSVYWGRKDYCPRN